MKKLLLFIFLMFALVGCNFQATGTTAPVITVDRDNFIEITTVDELKNIEMNKSYILMNDLDLTGLNWLPLGDFNNPYLGIFDGNDKVISNLEITSDNTYNGFFGLIEGEVFDLEIKDFLIDYESEFVTYAGGLAGSISGEVDNITLSGDISVINTFSKSYVGLLGGQAKSQLLSTDVSAFEPAIISNVFVKGTIDVIGEKHVYVGGLIGQNFNGRIHDNTVDVNISAESLANSAIIGGLVGHNYNGITAGYEVERIVKNVAVYNNFAESFIIGKSENDSLLTGGLFGYSSYGNTYGNILKTTIFGDGKEHFLSLLIAEDSSGLIKDTIVIGNLESYNLQGVNVFKEPLIAESYGDKTIVNTYFSDITMDFLDYEQYQEFDNLLDSDWYLANFDWEEDFILKVITFLN